MSETRIWSIVTGSDGAGVRRESQSWRPFWAFSVVTTLAVFFAGIVLFSTADGLAIGQRDGPSYLSSAEMLEAGLGYRTPYGDPGKQIDFEDPTSPVVDFPPGYPSVLSVGVMLGQDSKDVARALGALLVVGIFLLVYATTRSIPRFRATSSGAVLAAVIAAGLTLPYTTFAASEPLYGFLLILCLTATVAFVQTRRPLPLVIATTLAASAVFVRNGGLALVATVALVAWLTLRGSRWRWLVPVAVVVGAVAPFLVSTALGGRVLAWHPPGWGSFKELANGVAEWFVPPVGSPTLRVLLFVALLVGLLAWSRPWRAGAKVVAEPNSSLPVFVGVIAAGAHLGLIVVSKFLLSDQLSFGSRQIYPIGLGLLLASLQYLNTRSDRDVEDRVARSFLILGLCAAVATSWVGLDALNGVASGLQAFNSTEFKQSDPVEFVVDTVPGENVFTNIPDGLWVAGLAYTRPVPIVYDPLSLEENELFEVEMGRLADRVEGGAMLFYHLDGRPYLVGLDELLAMAPCVVVEDNLSLVLASLENPACPGS